MIGSGAARAASTFGVVGFLLVGAVGGCSSGDDGQDDVTPNVEIVDHTRSGLGATAVKSINGTYVGCFQRSGAWSVNVSGGTLTNPALTVVKDDTSCTLQVTEVVADQTYAAAAAMTLTTSYAANATAFAPSSGGSTAFMANAMLSAVDFASNFTLTLLYSDDLSQTTAPDVTGNYATVQASSAVLTVTAPNYTISLTSGTPFTFQLDANKIVQSVAGNASLTDGTITGSGYVIDNGTLPASPTYVSVALVYAAGTERLITGSNPVIPSSYFSLTGQNLTSTVVRTVIVSRTVSGVKAYQLFKISFKAP